MWYDCQWDNSPQETNNTEMNSYRSTYSLQQWAKAIKKIEFSTSYICLYVWVICWLLVIEKIYVSNYKVVSEQILCGSETNGEIMKYW